MTLQSNPNASTYHVSSDSVPLKLLSRFWSPLQTIDKEVKVNGKPDCFNINHFKVNNSVIFIFCKNNKTLLSCSKPIH